MILSFFRHSFRFLYASVHTCTAVLRDFHMNLSSSSRVRISHSLEGELRKKTAKFVLLRMDESV